MDILLCIFRRSRSPPILRLNSVVWNGLCWHAGYGLGLDHSHDFYSVRCYGHGYVIQSEIRMGWLTFVAELCSSMPTSGGLYYASAVLAPPGYGPLAAWITGWSNWLAQVTGAPSVDYALSAMVLAAVSITSPTYVPQNWHVFLLTAFIMILHACISSMPTRWIAQFNSYGSTFNIIALLITIIIIPAANNRPEQGLPRFASSKSVWGEFYEGTDYPNGIAVIMSFVAVIWTMSGYDAPFHLSEECSNANIASPRAIVLTSAIGGLFGWFLQLVTAYTVISIDDVLESDLGQPWAAYLLQILPQNTALAVLGMTIVCGFSMGQGCMVAASRVTYAYARDDCFPLSRIWKKVNRRTQTPVNAVWFNTTIGILLVTLLFAGDIAIGAIFSIAAIAAFVAFTIPITIRTFFVGNRFRPGPWHLGKYSPIVGTLATCFTLLMIPILCLPSVTGNNLDPSLMNWTCLVWGAPMLGSMVWWVVDAHKCKFGLRPGCCNQITDETTGFKGPKINIEHAMLGREGNVIDSKEANDDSSQEGGAAADKKAINMA